MVSRIEALRAAFVIVEMVSQMPERHGEIIERLESALETIVAFIRGDD